MKILTIYCQNCKGRGMIDHPKRMICPFCEGIGNKDIEYDNDTNENDSETKEETHEN